MWTNYTLTISDNMIASNLLETYMLPTLLMKQDIQTMVIYQMNINH